ncbi:MAG: VCBS repeat-containing protein [Planctomycetes bacterium]|nr:VCBS repeat-containing protein [Planctomycetota bacterium]
MRCMLALIAIAFGATEAFAADNFSSPVSYPAGYRPNALAAADLNGDHRDDLCVVNFYNNTFSVFYAQPQGILGPPIDYANAYYPTNILATDLNGDGRKDLLVTNQATSVYAKGAVSVYLGLDTGGFASPTNYTVSAYQPISVATSNVNNDAYADLVVGVRNFTSGYDEVNVFYGLPGGTFATDYLKVIAGDELGQVKTGDFNGDGRPDLVMSVHVGNTVNIMYGQEGGAFVLGETRAAGHTPNGLVVDDFNHDGMQDVAVAPYNSNGIYVFSGVAGGGLNSGDYYATVTSPTDLCEADFNRDGIGDLAAATGYWYTDNISVLYGLPGGGFGGRTDFPAGNAPTDLATGDFNGDGLPDLAAVNYLDGTVSVILNTMPEPATLSLLALGGLALLRRKRASEAKR